MGCGGFSYTLFQLQLAQTSIIQTSLKVDTIFFSKWFWLAFTSKLSLSLTFWARIHHYCGI